MKAFFHRCFNESANILTRMTSMQLLLTDPKSLFYLCLFVVLDVLFI